MRNLLFSTTKYNGEEVLVKTNEKKTVKRPSLAEYAKELTKTRRCAFKDESGGDIPRLCE